MAYRLTRTRNEQRIGFSWIISKSFVTIFK